jgi:hypothetical protein
MVGTSDSRSGGTGSVVQRCRRLMKPLTHSESMDKYGIIFAIARLLAILEMNYLHIWIRMFEVDISYCYIGRHSSAPVVDMLFKAKMYDSFSYTYKRFVYPIEIIYHLSSVYHAVLPHGIC